MSGAASRTQRRRQAPQHSMHHPRRGRQPRTLPAAGPASRPDRQELTLSQQRQPRIMAATAPVRRPRGQDPNTWRRDARLTLDRRIVAPRQQQRKYTATERGGDWEQARQTHPFFVFCRRRDNVCMCLLQQPNSLHRWLGTSGGSSAPCEAFITPTGACASGRQGRNECQTYKLHDIIIAELA